MVGAEQEEKTPRFLEDNEVDKVPCRGGQGAMLEAGRVGGQGTAVLKTGEGGEEGGDMHGARGVGDVVARAGEGGGVVARAGRRRRARSWFLLVSEFEVLLFGSSLIQNSKCLESY